MIEPYKKRINCYVPLCFGQVESMGMCMYHYTKMVKGEKVE